MKHEEATKLYLEAEETGRRAHDACPSQFLTMENNAGHVAWAPTWGEDKKLGYRFSVYPWWLERDAQLRQEEDTFLSRITPEDLRRIIEIKEALERWKWNEGPWPLSPVLGPELP